MNFNLLTNYLKQLGNGNMKNKFVFVLLAIIVTIGFCAYFLIPKILKSDKVEDVYTTVIDSREDLTKLLEYDFKNADIEAVYSNNESRCLCVVLNENYEQFSKDNITQGQLFNTGDGEGTFNYLKKSFPEIFVMNFSDVKNDNGTGKYYEYYFSDNYSECEPYYVYWFSTHMDGKEKCVIYAFLPKQTQKVIIKDFI